MQVSRLFLKITQLFAKTSRLFDISQKLRAYSRKFAFIRKRFEFIRESFALYCKSGTCIRNSYSFILEFKVLYANVLRVFATDTRYVFKVLLAKVIRFIMKLFIYLGIY